MAEGEEAVKKARAALRGLLSAIHVLDALPTRSRMLAVDAELPIHSVLAAALDEQHVRPPRALAAPPGAPTAEPPGPPHEHPQQPQPLRGAVPAGLAGNVLAEVCEFDCWGEKRRSSESEITPVEGGADGDGEKPPTRRRWTSPDDGWGMNRPMQELEKMPMGMPVTIGELADFLVHACAGAPAKTLPNSDVPSERWAEKVGGAPPTKERACSEDGCIDMLDWSLAQWRAHRLKLSGHKAPCEADGGKDEAESASRLFVEERPRFCGPVLVHRVPLAPPRPILCTDDPEASLLKAVEILLAYPELDALPIVSPVRCTVVAHLTLSCCLAYALGRMRGTELTPLASFVVSAQDGADGARRVFDSASCPEQRDCWAERRAPAANQSSWVLRQSQPLRELLVFFAQTHHSDVAVVEDGGGIIGVLSRRNLLDFLDLAMQSARRRPNNSHAGTDAVGFDAAAPIAVVLETLQRYRRPLADESALAGAAKEEAQEEPDANTRDKISLGVGATLIYEQQLTLKALLPHLLGAENQKLVFVQDTGNGSPPRLLRELSIGDVWHLLLGDAPEHKEETAEDVVTVTEP